MNHKDEGIVSTDDKLKSLDKEIVIKDILKKILSSSTFKKVSLTVISSITAYFFYILGYIFLYSYSFPGDVENKSIFQMYLKQVPFDLKVNIVIGVVLLIIIISIIIPLINIYFGKDLITSWAVFVSLSIIYIKGISCIILSNTDNDSINRIIYITGFVSFIPLFMFSLMYDVEMLNKKAKRSSIIILFVVIILILACILFNINTAWITIAFYVLVTIINFLFNLKSNKNQLEVIVDSKNNNKENKLNINMIPIILSLICAASLGLSIMFLEFMKGIGSFAGSCREKESQVIIKYQDGSNKLKELKGEIVVTNDDKYYISSSKSGRLIIIKSDTVIEIHEEDEE